MTISNSQIRVVFALRESRDLQRIAAPSSTSSDIEIIGETSSGRDAISVTKALQPDVLVIDLSLSDMDGLAAARLIRDFAPEIAILFRTSEPDENVMMSMLEAGAANYIEETATQTELYQTIRATADGASAFTSVITSRLLRKALGQIATPPPTLLSPRELDVLRCAARKLSNKSIADELNLSFRTVQTHLANIYGKLSVVKRSQAVARAVEEGWITEDFGKGS